jgi:ketosteroid isomerase-like protein
MNRVWKLLLVITLVCCKVTQGYSQSTEETVRNLHEAYCRAVEKKDSIFLKNLFHDKMIITSGNGTRRDKQGEIKDALDPRYTVNFFRARNVDVRVFENTAIVTGELFWEMVFDGRTTTNERVFTFSYAKIGNSWKIVAQHMGRVPPK